MIGAPPVSWAATRVLKACTELTVGEKLVWLEIWGMSEKSAERCFLSAGRLAGRLGMKIDTIEKTRRELKRAGVLGSAPRPGRREASWWPVIPSNCKPSSIRPDDDSLFELARAL